MNHHMSSFVFFFGKKRGEKVINEIDSDFKTRRKRESGTTIINRIYPRENGADVMMAASLHAAMIDGVYSYETDVFPEGRKETAFKKKRGPS